MPPPVNTQHPLRICRRCQGQGRYYIKDPVSLSRDEAVEVVHHMSRYEQDEVWALRRTGAPHAAPGLYAINCLDCYVTGSCPWADTLARIPGWLIHGLYVVRKLRGLPLKSRLRIAFK